MLVERQNLINVINSCNWYCREDKEYFALWTKGCHIVVPNDPNTNNLINSITVNLDSFTLSKWISENTEPEAYLEDAFELEDQCKWLSYRLKVLLQEFALCG